MARKGRTFLRGRGKAGVASTHDASAAAASLPQPDSIDVWPLVSFQNESSPRTEVPLSILPAGAPLVFYAGAEGLGYFVGGEGLVVGDLKLVVGYQHLGPFDIVTNATCASLVSDAAWSQQRPGVPCDCQDGCLFDIRNDPNERFDLALHLPSFLNDLKNRLEDLRATVFAPDRGPIEQAACDQIEANGGFWGPWL